MTRIECPICKTVLREVPDDFEWRPFCSSRCKLADLHNWLTEQYRVSEPVPLTTPQEPEKKPN
ncbi:MAG TPA: DNA gyrase inhibitor YacG [Polyangiaceae bacterium]|nr:MAG: DNA gyrase inhibitor YacG [Pseudomonadota bacterium]HLV64246.1 DNA gyrase inhibitor YacG [Polyangiaceae bacterium]